MCIHIVCGCIRSRSVCADTFLNKFIFLLILHFGIKMFAARGVLRLVQRLAGVSVSRRGCAGAVPVDDIVNGLTDEQIQVN